MQEASDAEIGNLLANTDEPPNLAFELVQGFSGNRMIEAYNKGTSLAMQKVWVELPQGRVCAHPSLMSSTSHIKLAYAPYISEHLKCITFVGEVERQATEYAREKLHEKALTTKSSIGKIGDSTNTIRLRVATRRGEHIVCYNGSNTPVALSEIRHGSLVLAYVELSNILVSDTNDVSNINSASNVDGKKEMSFNWTILQLKVRPAFSFSKCLFDRKRRSAPTPPHPEPSPIQPLPMLSCRPQSPFSPPPPPPIRTLSLPPAPAPAPSSQAANGRLMFLPTVSMLTDMRSRLRVTDHVSAPTAPVREEPRGAYSDAIESYVVFAKTESVRVSGVIRCLDRTFMELTGVRLDG